MVVQEGQKLWEPGTVFAGDSNLQRFMTWLQKEKGRALKDYHALWAWSVKDIPGFWEAIWEYFQVQSDTPYNSVISDYRMPGARWFDGAKVNYAEHLLRAEKTMPDQTVFHHLSETRELARMSWSEVGSQVRKLATRMREMGLQPGDRVFNKS